MSGASIEGKALCFDSSRSFIHLILEQSEGFACRMEKDANVTPKRTSSVYEPGSSHTEAAPIGRENLSAALPPLRSYEGLHRYDPAAKWSEAEERKVVRKTDLYLLSWICFMVRCPFSYPRPLS